MKQFRLNTGFRRHIDLLVDNEGEQPEASLVAAAKNMLGEKAEQRWFNVSGLGYDKNWMWVLGV